MYPAYLSTYIPTYLGDSGKMKVNTHAIRTGKAEKAVRYLHPKGSRTPQARATTRIEPNTQNIYIEVDRYLGRYVWWIGGYIDR